MLWILMALLVIAGAAAAIQRRRAYESPDEEPWRASLGETDGLDIDAIREAEEEWLRDESWEDPDDEEWR
jgi:hypothetical protein